MAAPKEKLPQSIDELRRLVDEHGVSKTAEMFGASKTAVYSRLSRYGKEPTAPGMEFAPWWVRPAHAGCQTGRNLRLLHQAESGTILKLGSGRSMDDIVMSLVTDWKLKVESNNYVISYHPDTPSHKLEPRGGFYYRPRTSTDSPGIMQPHPEGEPAPDQDILSEWAENFRRNE